jgi:hypothetical protein
MAPRGKALFGYFFGPRLTSSAPVDLVSLRPEEAVLSMMFGDLGLYNRTWNVVGELAPWDRANWPMPKFQFKDPLINGRWAVRTYDEDDISKLPQEESIWRDAGLPEDGHAGARYIEEALDDLLP